MMKGRVSDDLVSEMWSICGGAGSQTGGDKHQVDGVESGSEDGSAVGASTDGYDRPPAFSTGHGLRNTLGRGGGEGTIGELEKSCVGGYMGGTV